MAKIQRASDQYVANTQRSEAAARNMNELGQRLQQLVEEYKI